VGTVAFDERSDRVLDAEDCLAQSDDFAVKVVAGLDRPADGRGGCGVEVGARCPDFTCAFRKVVGFGQRRAFEVGPRWTGSSSKGVEQMSATASRTAAEEVTGTWLEHDPVTRPVRHEAAKTGHIVVGVDESAGAASALRWAVREAEARESSLTAVLAWDFLDQHHLAAGAPFDPAYSEADAVNALRSIVVGALGEVRAATIEQNAVCDLPAAALLEQSAGADLLVVGARGMGRFRKLLVGSVSQQCLHLATCPVAVVRQGADRAAEGIGRIIVGIDGSETARRALEWALEEARIHQASVVCIHAWRFQDGSGYRLSPRWVTLRSSKGPLAPRLMHVSSRRTQAAWPQSPAR